MISIIIPIYNVEKYIVDCLKSIEQQTFKDFEVIIVDDGSTDKTVEVVDHFNKNFNYKVIKQENKGVSAARNVGIQASRGKYLCFVDSDDVLDKNYLRILYDSIQNSDIAIVKKEDISEVEHMYLCEKVSGKYTTYDKNSALHMLLMGRLQVGIWGLLSKAELFQNNFFAEGYAYSEDLEMVWRLIASANSIAICNDQLYGYRLRDGSAMTKMNKKRLQGLELFEKLEVYLERSAPEFSEEYKKYGVAKWLWSTIWQEAVASNNYYEFKQSIEKYTNIQRMKSLYSYPNNSVRLSTHLFFLNRYLYYVCIKVAKRKYRTIKKA